MINLLRCTCIYTCCLTSGTLNATSMISWVGTICHVGATLLSALNIRITNAFGFMSSAICTFYFINVNTTTSNRFHVTCECKNMLNHDFLYFT